MDTLDSLFEEAGHLADACTGVIYDRLIRRLQKQIRRTCGPLPPTCEYRVTAKKLRKKEKRIENFAEKRDFSFERAMEVILGGNYASTYLPLVVRRYFYHEARLPKLTECRECLSCRMALHGIGGLQRWRPTRRTARIRSKEIMKSINASINSAVVAESDLSSAFVELLSSVIQEETEVNCG